VEHKIILKYRLELFYMLWGNSPIRTITIHVLERVDKRNFFYVQTKG